MQLISIDKMTLRSTTYDLKPKSNNLLKKSIKNIAENFHRRPPIFWQSCNSIPKASSICRAELNNFALFLSYLPKTIYFKLQFSRKFELQFSKKIPDGRKKG